MSNTLTSITGYERLMCIDAAGVIVSMDGAQLAAFLAIVPKAGPEPVSGGRARGLTGAETLIAVDDDGLPTAMNVTQFVTFAALPPQSVTPPRGNPRVTTPTGYERFLALDAYGFPITLSGVDIATFVTAPAANLWTPANLTTPPLEWFDAQDAATITGSSVSAWANKGSAAVNTAQATGANRPAFVASSNLNTKPALRFDGSNDFLAATFGASNIGGSLLKFYCFNSVSAMAVDLLLANASQATYPSNSLAPLTTPCITNTQWSGTTIAHYQDGNPVGTNTAASALAAAGSVFAASRAAGSGGGGQGRWIGPNGLGNFTGLSRAFNGDIGEIIFLNYSPTPEERLYLEGYLAWRWGTQNALPFDHPFVNYAPVVGATTPVGDPPIITSAATASVAENNTLAFVMTADDVTSTWSINGGADAALFEVSGSTLRWVGNGTKNFEAPNDVGTNNVYEVVYQATNTFGSTTQTLAVTVTDVAEGTAPTITSGATTSVDENQPLVFAMNSSDPAATWDISGGADAARFEVSGSTLRWVGNGTKDYEAPNDAGANNVYDVIYRATNAFGNSTQALAVTVINLAEPTPLITSGATVSVAENSTLAFTMVADDPTSVWDLSGGADIALFEVSGTTLRWAGNISKDYEFPNDAGTNNVYNVIYRATNLYGNTTKALAVTVTDVADTGAFSNVALNVGNLTRAGHGGVLLSSATLGVLNSGAVTAWNLVRTSGDATAWGTNLADGETPKPLRALTVADAGTTATWQIWADGVNTGKTLTINVESAAVSSGYTVAKSTDIDSTSTGLRATAVKSALGGRRILFQRGSETKWNNPTYGGSATAGQIAWFRGFNTHLGVVSLESSDAAHPTTIGRLLIQGCKGITVDGTVTAPLLFKRSIPPTLNGGTPATIHNNYQNLPIVHVMYSSANLVSDTVLGTAYTNLANSNIILNGLTVTSDDGLQDPTDARTWVTGIVVAGNPGASNTGWSANITVSDCSVARVKDGINVSETNNALVTRNTVDRFCSNAMFCGGGNWQNTTISYGVHKRPMYNSSDPGDHADFLQVGTSLVHADYTNITISYMKLLTLDGDSSSHGNYWDDYDKNGAGVLTGFKAVNCSIHHILYEGSESHGQTLGIGQGWAVSNVTTIRGKMPNLVLRSPDGTLQTVADPSVRYTLQGGQGAVGTSIKNASHAFLAGVGSPWMVQTNDVAYGAMANTTGGYSTRSTDSTAAAPAIAAVEAYRQSFYATWFQMGGSGDPEVEARPKVGGPLDLGGGQWAGALNSTGGWA